jgi:FdrA protein
LPSIRKARQWAQKENREIAFVASICGTDGDPQNYTRQIAKLEEAGVSMLQSNAQAARYTGLLLKG